MHNQFVIRTFYILFSLFLLSAEARSQFNEDFSDTDLTTGVEWVGDLEDFTVINSMLQLQAAAAGSSTLSTLSTFTDSLRFGADILLRFAPSGDNQLRIYLYHEVLDVGIAEALYLELGESGSADAFTLRHRSFDGTITDVQRFASIPHGSSLNVTVLAEFLSGDDWMFSFDHNDDGNFDDVQSVLFNFSPDPNGYFGIACRYTSTRVDKFLFDDIFIEKIIADKTPPVLLSAKAVAADKVILTFDEAIDGASLRVDQFTITPGMNNPSNIVWSSSNAQQICLLFANDLVNQQMYLVEATNIKDEANNAATALRASFILLVPETIDKGDIIINEIHAAPSSMTPVANAEFVELYNRSSKILNITDLKFGDASTTISLPSYFLFPGEHIIITDADDVGLFEFTDTVVGAFGFPSLNNSGDDLTLSTGSIIIDQVQYTSFWYGDDDKTSGWSLECRNPESLCRGSANWIASTDPTGGTPGEINSVFSADEPPGIARIEQARVTSNSTVGFVFNIEMNEDQLADQANFSIEPSITIASSEVDIVAGRNVLKLTFTEELKQAQVYRIIFNSSVCSCNGGKWSVPYSFAFGLSELATDGDLRISEILFSPNSGASEFIEIFNASLKVIDINDIWLHLLNPSQTVRRIQLVADFQLLPDEYHVMTVNPQSVIDEYTVPYPDQVHQFAVPSLSNSGAILTLYTFDQNGDSIFIDHGIYSENLHDPLLDESNGVSLERLQLNGDGLSFANWYSASTIAGGATPTGENSQKSATVERNSVFTLNSPTFSPDSDGFEDLMLMLFEFDKPGYVVQANVFSYDGVLIKKLLNNASAGSSGQFAWSGDTDDGDRARIGIYYVLIEAFHIDGDTIKDKKKIVLARQL